MMLPLQPPPPLPAPYLHPTYSYPYLVSMRNLLEPGNPHFCGKPHPIGVAMAAQLRTVHLALLL